MKQMSRRSLLLRIVLPAVLVLATYPFALIGHLLIDLALGDRQLLRELVYGYDRIVAARLVDGWLRSLIWVVAIWAVLHAASRWLPSLYTGLAVLAAAVVIGLAIGTPLPPLIVWLVLAAILLHTGNRVVTQRLLPCPP